MAMKPNAAPSERFWMVVKEGQSNNAPTHRHATVQAAIQEAERLAAMAHGLKFYVVESVGFAQKVIPSSFTWVAE